MKCASEVKIEEKGADVNGDAEVVVADADKKADDEVEDRGADPSKP